MRTPPTPEQIRAALAALAYSYMDTLAQRSGVPVTTLRKIRSGETADPRLSTAVALAPHIKEPKK